MATRLLLADLVPQGAAAGLGAVQFESVGGVDAARRVQAGEPFDLVVLADDAIDKLIAGAHLQAPSKRALVRSPLAAAVRAGMPAPDIRSDDALRAALLAARSIGYSTGPSGNALLALFERWGLTETLHDRLVQAPPGVPVGSLVARGDVELGFQQLSELLHLPGLTLLAEMPPSAQIVTTFSGAVGRHSANADAAAAWLDWVRTPATHDTIRRHGMSPV